MISDRSNVFFVMCVVAVGVLGVPSGVAELVEGLADEGTTKGGIDVDGVASGGEGEITSSSTSSSSSLVSSYHDSCSIHLSSNL